MITFTLDDEKHIYYANLARCPGVTEILTGTGIVKYPDYESVRMGRYRGSVVARAIECHEKGTLDMDALNRPDLTAIKVPNYFQGFLRFKDKWVARVVNFETIVGHQVFIYGGRLDMIIMTLDGRLVLIDYKTGPIQKWVELQCTSYLEAYRTNPLLKDFPWDEVWYGAVQLNPDGTYCEPVLSKDRRPFKMFLQAMNVFNYAEAI